jgi:hypothetical protein
LNGKRRIDRIYRMIRIGKGKKPVILSIPSTVFGRFLNAVPSGSVYPEGGFVFHQALVFTLAAANAACAVHRWRIGMWYFVRPLGVECGVYETN